MSPFTVALPPTQPATWVENNGMISFQQFPDALVALSADGAIQHVNGHFEGLAGRKAADLHGIPFRDILVPEDRPVADSFFHNSAANKTVKNVVLRLAGKDDTVYHVSWSSYWSAADGLIICSGRDVTEFVNARQNLMAKEQLFQALIDNSFDILALTDANGNYLYVSDTLSLSYGYAKDELLGVNCFTLIHPDDLPRISAHNNLLQQQKKVQVPPYRFRTATGEWHWTEAIVTNQLGHPDINGIVICARNVHQQYNTEKKLKEMQLLEALREGEEKERTRIARDLHDGVSGLIAAAKMHFETIGNQSAAIREWNGFLQGMQLLEKAANAVRRTSHNLMPEILLENGLAEALQRYCDNVRNEELDMAFIAIGNINRFPIQFELSLYRIAQELIGNIIRHAKATEAILQVSQHNAIFSLTIEDNGQGFCPDQPGSGTGLSSIRRRVSAMNGSMEIRSARGSGTQVYLEFAT